MGKHIFLIISSLVITLMISSCGGGGGSSSSSPGSQLPVTPQPGTQYTKAIVTIKLSGSLPVGKSISGAGFTMYFPSNLTPALTVNNSIAPGVVTLSGAFSGGTLGEAVYTPAATTTSYGNMLITAADTSQDGVLQVGEIAQITLQVSNNVYPTVQSFMITSNGVIDMFGKPIATVTPVITDILLQ